MNSIAERLSKAISDSKLSYADLGEMTNIAKSSIQRYATGKTKKIPIDAVQKIAEATHSSAAWIMGWADTTSPENKKNDIISDIILRLRADEQFLDVVVGVADLSKDQLAAVKTFLSAFK